MGSREYQREKSLFELAVEQYQSKQGEMDLERRRIADDILARREEVSSLKNTALFLREKGSETKQQLSNASPRNLAVRLHFATTCHCAANFSLIQAQGKDLELQRLEKHSRELLREAKRLEQKERLLREKLDAKRRMLSAAKELFEVGDLEQRGSTSLVAG